LWDNLKKGGGAFFFFLETGGERIVRALFDSMRPQAFLEKTSLPLSANQDNEMFMGLYKKGGFMEESCKS